MPRKVLLCNNADAGKVDRQEATGAARVRGGGCGDYYYLAKHSAMHWFGKQKQLHAGDRWGGGRGGRTIIIVFLLGGSLRTVITIVKKLAMDGLGKRGERLISMMQLLNLGQLCLCAPVHNAPTSRERKRLVPSVSRSTVVLSQELFIAAPPHPFPHVAAAACHTNPLNYQLIRMVTPPSPTQIGIIIIGPSLSRLPNPCTPK